MYFHKFKNMTGGPCGTGVLKKNIIPGTLAAILAAVIFLAFPGELHAITLRELGNAIASLDSEQEVLIEEIVASETIVEARKNEIAVINEELRVLGEEIQELEYQKQELTESIEAGKALLADRAVFTYKYGNNDVARFIISARNLNEVVNNLYLFKTIMIREAELIQTLRLEKEDYDRISRKSEEKMMENELLRAKLEEEKEKLEKDIAGNRVLLDRLEGEEEEVQELLAAIKKRIAAIQPAGLTLVGEWEMTATGYYAFGSGGNDINGNGITATGLRARKGIVAVDPRVIPLGTRLYVPGYGEALAADTGGWIKDQRIDLCFETLEECYRFGRRKIRIYLVED